MQSCTQSISIVVPLFNEERNLPILVDRLKRLKTTLAPTELEIVFVDDGSSDTTYPTLERLSPALGNVRLLALAPSAMQPARRLENSSDFSSFYDSKESLREVE